MNDLFSVINLSDIKINILSFVDTKKMSPFFGGFIGTPFLFARNATIGWGGQREVLQLRKPLGGGKTAAVTGHHAPPWAKLTMMISHLIVWEHHLKKTHGSDCSNMKGRIDLRRRTWVLRKMHPQRQAVCGLANPCSQVEQVGCTDVRWCEPCLVLV